MEEQNDDPGVDIVILDRDGNMEALLPIWLDCGMNGFYPCRRPGCREGRTSHDDAQLKFQVTSDIPTTAPGRPAGGRPVCAGGWR